MLYSEKDNIIADVEAIAEMLGEAQNRLSKLPRNQTAARQLALIGNRLEGWKRTFGPVEKHQPMPKNSPYSRSQVDKALKAYRKYGFRGMTREMKEIFLWWDENFPEN